MKSLSPILALALLVAHTPAQAQDKPAASQSTLWSPKLTSANGTEWALTGNLAYDLNNFSGAGYGTSTTLQDDDAWRRQEIGVTIKRKGYYDFGATFDFQAKTWLDVALRLETKPLFGRDLGKVRIGQMKLPLGFEGNTATRNGSFMENSLPTQAFYQSRRSGIDWAFERPAYIVNAGYFFESDLQGNNKGDTAAVRAAWTPLKEATRVLHLGVSASQENPDSEINGRSVEVFPSIRWRAKPEAALTGVRFVDSGNLSRVHNIRRTGVEALWIDGPWSVQGEYLRQKTERELGLPSYSADGGYIFGSWMATGESRVYSGSNVANPKPTGKYGAVELLVRYSRIDLDNDGIAGGRQQDWTLGANWYLNRYFKFQANHVWIDAERVASSASPRVFELRAQLSF